MTYQEALDTIRETMTDQGISVGDMAKYFVDNQKELEISDRDLGILLAGLDLENGEGLQYITPEAKEALQAILDEGSEEGEEPAPTENAMDVEEPAEDATEEIPEAKEPENKPTEEDDEAVEEEGSEEDTEDEEVSEDSENDERENMKKMFYN